MKVIEFPRHSVRFTSEEVAALGVCIDIVLNSEYHSDYLAPFTRFLQVARNLKDKLEPYLGETN